MKTEEGIIQELKGSGEIHINDLFTNYTQLISDEVWNWENRTLTEPVNITANSLDETVTAIWNYTGTINTNLLNQIASAVWAHTSRILTAFNLWEHETAADYIWNNTNRNLTDAPNVNVTKIANATWEWPIKYTHGVDLT